MLLEVFLLFIVVRLLCQKALTNFASWKSERKKVERKRKKRFHKAHMGFICHVYFTSAKESNLFRLLIKAWKVLMMFTLFARNKILTKISSLLCSRQRLKEAEEDCTRQKSSALFPRSVFIFIFEAPEATIFSSFIELLTLVSLWEINFKRTEKIPHW